MCLLPTRIVIPTWLSYPSHWAVFQNWQLTHLSAIQNWENTGVMTMRTNDDVFLMRIFLIFGILSECLCQKLFFPIPATNQSLLCTFFLLLSVVVSDLWQFEYPLSNSYTSGCNVFIIVSHIRLCCQHVKEDSSMSSIKQ